MALTAAVICLLTVMLISLKTSQVAYSTENKNYKNTEDRTIEINVFVR